MPFLQLSCGYYAVFFAISVFFFPTPRPLPMYGRQIAALSIEAQVIVLLGIMLMILAYFSVDKILSEKRIHIRLPKSYDPTRLRILLWMLIVVFLGWYLFPELRKISSVNQFIQPAGPLAIAMMIVLWRKRLLSKYESILSLAIILPIIILLGFLSGLLTGGVLLCAFLAVILFYTGFRKFWVVGLAPALIVITIYPGVAGYRAFVWDNQSEQLDVIQRVKAFSSATHEAWTREEDFFKVTALEPLIHRLSGHVLMTKVVDRTPYAIPYWSGETYGTILTNLVPRVVWPNKPKERWGQAFAHRYELISPRDTITSINIPWVVEMYANFGRAGVLVGMTIVGAFLALLSAIFNRSTMTPLEFVVGAAIIFPLVYPASNFTLMTGTMAQLTLALWLYFRFGLTIGAHKNK
ncbi:MAG: hypothetical protein CMM52_10450 [Rhodospirillaceae bacterium]|nr:hypothetical protein [Rhodospirillaceae bacterium]|tara:strand:+ start:16024 stop:17247 length:1224 start_codon:yes stop_codon:yes gene_type:complete